MAAVTFEQLRLFVWNHPLYLIATYFCLRLIYNKFQPGLSKIPGPVPAAYTKFWRVYKVWQGSAHLTAIELHKKYGSVVRVAPNHVSISDPAYIPIIYDPKDTFIKSAFYPIQCISWKKRPEYNIFSTQDIDQHRAQKRRITNAYSLPNILQSEEAIDSCIRILIDKLDMFASKDQPVDLGAWLQYYTFDVIGEITFAMKLGFLEEGKDVDGMIKAIEGMIAYAALCGQVPEYHKYLLGNPLFTAIMPAMETWNQVVIFTLKAMNQRASIKRDGELIDADVEGRDMLSKWACVKQSDPLKMTTKDIVVHTSTNVFAGSDTTAIVLRAIIYFLCRNPLCMEKAVAEVDLVDQAGHPNRPFSYKEAIAEFPYLNAILKETMRLHPSIGFMMERVVPAEGLEIAGYHLPAGTVVGINPWVTNRNESVFPKPDLFDPDRWLDSSPEQLKQMDAVWEYNFGSGSRKCIGRHIGWIEMLKVVPELMRNYEITLAHPERDWKVVNHWFVQQEGVICKLVKRHK